ncbi:hypothetical protein KO528_06950 [Saccharophagus degradans]|uniref:hypothetical protein n=1 Tax=Saccharophagus degradans TaxID=86304 RepID=UPI001C09919D|nr:hypothetical protein [Saccharophagus degradans]MBU2985081.1 hypothetical protein [Saccharophagus degradans]
MRSLTPVCIQIIASIGLAAAISGCASTPKEPVISFTTHIYLDGTKSFDYTSTMQSKNKSKPSGKRDKPPRDGVPPKSDKPRKSHSSHEDGPNKEAIAQRAQQRLIELLNTNGYCREGYITLEEHIVRTSIAIKGQCIEQANEDDKILFPNTRKSKVTEEVINPL